MTEIAPVDVTMYLAAPPKDVFRFFTDPARYVQWMGSEAELEPVPGGAYRVLMPDGFAAAGQFLQVERPQLVVFSWGFADDEAAARTKHEGGEAGGAGAMPAGSTRVTVRLEGERSHRDRCGPSGETGCIPGSGPGSPVPAAARRAR